MFRLAHLSDPHLGPLPAPSWRELMGKRATGYLNWQRSRAAHHRMDVLDRLMADLAAEAPDHVAVTGDLINLGLEAEYPQARGFLWRLGPPDRVSFVPGNHDTYMRATVPGMVHHWRPWFLEDGADETTGGYAFPYLRRRGPVGIVGLCSGVPTPPFLATGAVGSRQIAAMQDHLEDLAREGLARVVLIHHPPFDIGWQKRLVDHAELAAALSRSGCELVLHGHTHRGTTREIAGPAGPIPVIGVPSASAAADGHEEPAAWNLVTIGGEPGNWRIDVERRAVASQAGKAGRRAG
jgi:3',5'-cyclic AMP phosphodiesterase CpdA